MNNGILEIELATILMMKNRLKPVKMNNISSKINDIN